jgi:hypothetical protein
VHSADAPKVVEASGTSTPSRPLIMTESADGKEVYTTPPTRNKPQKPAESSEAAPVTLPVPAKKVEDDKDDLEATVPHGTTCKRLGCNVTFVSNEENRIGDGPGTKCVYHRGAVRVPVPCIPPYAETVVITAHFS